MTVFRPIVAVVLILGALVAGVSASDRTGVYAKVDKVVFEPSEAAPRAVQVWGIFSIANRDNPHDYQPPARGYLYFTLPADAHAARLAVREWSDLKQVAGTGEIVAFGTRMQTSARVRKAADQARNPDVYAVNVGVNRVRRATEYPPVRLLVEGR